MTVKNDNQIIRTMFQKVIYTIILVACLAGNATTALAQEEKPVGLYSGTPKK